MTTTATVLRGPLNIGEQSSTIANNRILSWYSKYAKDFSTAKGTTSPSKYYASTATLVNTDQSLVTGAEDIWNYYTNLYGRFAVCSHDVISMTVLSNEQSNQHTLIVETINNLFSKYDRTSVPLPQAFVYEIGQSERESGTDGLQIWRVRCYFDMNLLQKVAYI